MLPLRNSYSRSMRPVSRSLQRTMPLLPAVSAPLLVLMDWPLNSQSCTAKAAGVTQIKRVARSVGRMVVQMM